MQTYDAGGDQPPHSDSTQPVTLLVNLHRDAVCRNRNENGNCIEESNASLLHGWDVLDSAPKLTYNFQDNIKYNQIFKFKYFIQTQTKKESEYKFLKLKVSGFVFNLANSNLCSVYTKVNTQMIIEFFTCPSLLLGVMVYNFPLMAFASYFFSLNTFFMFLMRTSKWPQHSPFPSKPPVAKHLCFRTCLNSFSLQKGQQYHNYKESFSKNELIEFLWPKSYILPFLCSVITLPLHSNVWNLNQVQVQQFK